MQNNWLIRILTIGVLMVALVACSEADTSLPTLAPTVGAEAETDTSEADEATTDTEADETETDANTDNTDNNSTAQNATDTLSVDIDYTRANGAGETGTASLSTNAPDGWSISEQSIVRPEVYTFLSLNLLEDSPVSYEQQAQSLPGLETTHDVNGVMVYEYRNENSGLPSFRRGFGESELIVTAFAYGDDNAVVLDYVDDLVQIIANAEIVASNLPDVDTSTVELSDGYTAFVSGAIEGSMVSGFGVDVCSGDTTRISYTNIFSKRDDEIGGDVSFTFAADATVGEYVYDPEFTELPTVDMSAYVEPLDESENYPSTVSYTLNLESVATAPGEAYSGTYTITLRRVSDSPDTTDTATVTGTFSHIMDELCS